MKMFLKKTTVLRLIVLLITSTFIFWLTGCDKPSQNKTEPLTMKLHWIPDAHQAGFWVGLDKGFYSEEGIDLTILPGGLDANPIRDVVSGSVDIGQIGGVEQAIIAYSEGLPIKAIAAIHRRTPHALISLKGNPIISKKDLVGKTIAVAYGDTAEILLNAFIKKSGITPESVKFTPFRFDLSPLLTGKVDAITGFSTGQPVSIKEKGKQPVVMSYEEAGVDSYGYTLITSEKAIQKKRNALKRFLIASRRGWDYVFKHPDDAAKIMSKRFKGSVEYSRTIQELDLIRKIMLDSNQELETWKLDAHKVVSVRNILKNHSKTNVLDNYDFIDNSLLK